MTWRAALAVVALFAAPAGAASLPALTAADWRRVDRGETVVHERTVAGYPWPEIVAYRRSAASPTAIMAVYADFAAQSSWVPDLVTSRVLGREAPNAFRVFYEYEVAGPNERYTVIVTVAREGDGWQARWTLISARYARKLAGALLVVQRGEGSLLVYSSRVDPGALGVAFGTSATMATSLVQTTEALTVRVERLAATEPGRLAALVDALEALATPRNPG
jgi:hypothetical protein